MCSPTEDSLLVHKYFQAVEKFWKFLPRGYSSYLVTVAIVVFGVTARGEWLLVVVNVLRQFGLIRPSSENLNSIPDLSRMSFSAETFHLKNWPTYWLVSSFIGYFIYFTVGGFLHWYFYVKQRDRPEDWKCQPTKWLPSHLERHEIVWGCICLLVTNFVSSLLSCYIANGGWCTLYYDFNEYPLYWYILQWPVVFVYQEYSTYWTHRLYHVPWMYKRFHKVHHSYLQPTAFSATAFHPVEILHVQLVSYSLPMFIIPTHWTTFTIIALVTYYNGLIAHSGIDFKAPWWQPWLPDTIFHDNHHQYFHVNYGFNCMLWDKIHGTARRADRIYNKDIFSGKGKPLTEATAEELKEEEIQRKAENKNAHRHLNLGSVIKQPSKGQENGTIAQKG